MVAVRSKKVKHANALGQCLAQSESLMIISYIVVVVIVINIIIMHQDHSDYWAWWKSLTLGSTCYVTLDQSLFLSRPQFPHLLSKVPPSINFPLFWSFLMALFLLSLFSFRARPGWCSPLAPLPKW